MGDCLRFYLDPPPVAVMSSSFIIDVQIRTTDLLFIVFFKIIVSLNELCLVFGVFKYFIVYRKIIKIATFCWILQHSSIKQMRSIHFDLLGVVDY